MQGDGKGSYSGKSREALLQLIRRMPSTQWPLSLPFSFKNKARVYGSVMLDAALRASLGDGSASESLATADEKFAAVLNELTAARP